MELVGDVHKVLRFVLGAFQRQFHIEVTHHGDDLAMGDYSRVFGFFVFHVLMIWHE